ncbi:MAG: hypothetical protein R3B47_09540 [Bacteroidia bacterium]
MKTGNGQEEAAAILTKTLIEKSQRPGLLPGCLYLFLFAPGYGPGFFQKAFFQQPDYIQFFSFTSSESEAGWHQQPA